MPCIMLSLLRHTPLGIPVLPDVYINTATCSIFSSLSTNESTSRVDLAPKLNNSEQVMISALREEMLFLDSAVKLSEKTMNLIGFLSPSFSNNFLTV